MELKEKQILEVIKMSGRWFVQTLVYHVWLTDAREIWEGMTEEECWAWEAGECWGIYDKCEAAEAAAEEIARREKLFYWPGEVREVRV